MQQSVAERSTLTVTYLHFEALKSHIPSYFLPARPYLKAALRFARFLYDSDVLVCS